MGVKDPPHGSPPTAPHEPQKHVVVDVLGKEKGGDGLGYCVTTVRWWLTLPPHQPRPFRTYALMDGAARLRVQLRGGQNDLHGPWDDRYRTPAH